jgi:hypothetical protein
MFHYDKQRTTQHLLETEEYRRLFYDTDLAEMKALSLFQLDS